MHPLTAGAYYAWLPSRPRGITISFPVIPKGKNMSTTVTSKGQVTIPKPIREYLGLRRGQPSGLRVHRRRPGNSPSGQVSIQRKKAGSRFAALRSTGRAPGHEHGRIHEANSRLRSRRGRSRFQKPQVILVDSSVLIDVIDEDRHWCGWSLAALNEWSRRGPVLINPVIYTEISPDFDHPAALDAVLEKVGIAYGRFPKRRCFWQLRRIRPIGAGQGKDQRASRTFSSVPTRPSSERRY